jgi:hypothetical protein
VALVRREMWRFSDGPLTRPLMNPHSAIPVLTVMNFRHGLLALTSEKTESPSRGERKRSAAM